ncbi:MAG: T9SS type A sorting domain-containing protein [Candidatus Cloacimonadota bacterium]|nr:MAG: T9SS type A sorting domain-containing protein [Candidatus Cloacimonadota bacterium]
MKKIIIICFFLLTGLISSSSAYNWDNPFIRDNEFLIDTNIIYIPVNGNYPSAAFDGTNYLVVWEDKRCGETSLNIFGTRVNQSGEVIDSTGIIISTASSAFHYDQRNPTAAFDGINYLVVWSDSRNEKDRIFGVRVNASGIVIDTVDFLIASSTTRDLWSPKVIFGGKYYFVVWKEGFPGSFGRILGARVDTAGNVIDTSSIIISSFIAYFPPSVSFDGKNYFAVWGVGTFLYGARIDSSGTVLDSTDIRIAINPGSKTYTSLAFDGKRYLVVWQDDRNFSFDIYGARVETSGVVVDTSVLPMVTTDYDVEYPKITFNREKYLLVWEDYRTGHADIYGSRVDTSCVILDTTGIPIAINAYEQHYPSVVSADSQFLTVWSEDYDIIYGSRIDTSGTVLDSSGITLSTAAYTEWYPSTSFDGSNYFVVWQDKRNGEDYDIYGARVDTTGVVLDPDCIPISSAVVNQQYPKVAFSGLNYLVVWQDDRYSSIYGARVDTSGVVLDPDGFIITSIQGRQHEPSLTFDGRNYFVVWHECNAPGDIYGTRIDTAGYVLDPSGIHISYNQLYTERHPATASNSSNYLVAWQEHGMRGTIVDTSGTVPDTAGFQITTYFWWGNPSITSNGIDYFVVWQDSRNPDIDIYGARVDSSGIVLDTAGIPIATAPGDQACPTVVFDGTDYIVLWEDYRNVFSDIYGARISTAGIVLDTFIVSIQEGNQFSPALSKGPGDKFLVTYSGFVDSINARPANTMRIWGSLFIPPVGIKKDKPISKSLLFSLNQNFPNPVFNETKIRFQIPEITKVENFPVSLSIYDLSGRLIKVFSLFTPHSSLITAVSWDCRDRKGKQVPNGIYFYRLNVGEKTAVRKMVVIR